MKLSPLEKKLLNACILAFSDHTDENIMLNKDTVKALTKAIDSAMKKMKN